MAGNFQMFISIMVFYMLLSYVLGPLAFYYLMDKSLTSAGQGYVAGSILSLFLWLTVGSKMIKPLKN
jgi:hypothetical protein